MIQAKSRKKSKKSNIIHSQDLSSILQNRQASIKIIWNDLRKKIKNENPVSIDKIVEKQEITEGEAMGKAYMTKGMSTTYASGENYSSTTKTNVYYESSKQNNHKQAKSEEMVHSPVIEHLIQIHNAGVSAQVYGKIKNQLMNVQTPNIEGDLYEKGKIALFNMTNKVLKELVYETSGVMIWF